ncbi:MAG: cytochrome P450 [Okeania sp. SIO2C9]|uniref:cytochrome P450 n=1 Tax=Okeania sp. SIO2C9 TaxID=2607791 RepID=UPI0013C02BD0|nr:cytochrome P450 [Okeania sp. SIO2C9]NEQ74041.1 cytochrome P450 [Okeania sp. SIO2C9]
MKSLLGGFRILWGIYFRGKYSYTQVTVMESEKYVLPTTLKEFADTEKNIIRQPSRPVGIEYFFAGFVYPFLPLDLSGSDTPSWQRIMQGFKAIMSHFELEDRCGAIARTQVYKLPNLGEESVKDSILRSLIVDIMWCAILDVETKDDSWELNTKQVLYNLIEDICCCFTENLDPDWKQRLEWCKHLAHFFEEGGKNSSNLDFLVQLRVTYSLSMQEWLTAIIMEFFVTPALEIAEVVTNIFQEYEDHPEILERAVKDEKYLRAVILAIACKYPVLQTMFRVADGKDVPYHINVEVADQTDLQFNPEDFCSNSPPPYQWIGFGSGPRVCKGRILAINIIESIIQAIYTKFEGWPKVEISSGRRVHPSVSLDERFLRLYGRAWIGRVFYRIDKVIRPSCPPARLYLPDSLFS